MSRALSNLAEADTLGNPEGVDNMPKPEKPAMVSPYIAKEQTDASARIREIMNASEDLPGQPSTEEEGVSEHKTISGSESATTPEAKILPFQSAKPDTSKTTDIEPKQLEPKEPEKIEKKQPKFPYISADDLKTKHLYKIMRQFKEDADPSLVRALETKDEETENKPFGEYILDIMRKKDINNRKEIGLADFKKFIRETITSKKNNTIGNKRKIWEAREHVALALAGLYERSPSEEEKERKKDEKPGTLKGISKSAITDTIKNLWYQGVHLVGWLVGSKKLAEYGKNGSFNGSETKPE